MKKITIGDLAGMVQQREKELAYRSETPLLSEFVAKFGYIDDNLLKDDTLICPAEYYAWEDAYQELCVRLYENNERW